MFLRVRSAENRRGMRSGTKAEFIEECDLSELPEGDVEIFAKLGAELTLKDKRLYCKCEMKGQFTEAARVASLHLVFTGQQLAVAVLDENFNIPETFFIKISGDKEDGKDGEVALTTAMGLLAKQLMDWRKVYHELVLAGSNLAPQYAQLSMAYLLISKTFPKVPPLPAYTVDTDSMRRSLLGRAGEEVMALLMLLAAEDLPDDRADMAARRQARLYALFHAMALK